MRAMFRNVAVPVDGSETSRRGLAFAIELVRDDGRIAICSVVDRLAASLPAAVLHENPDAYCTRAHDIADASGLMAWSEVLHGASADEIVAFAARYGVDAIVIGTHAGTGFARALLGSVAQGVLRRAPLPVVAVHIDDELRTGPLAVAFDASAGAQAALELGVAMAAARGLSLLILHVAQSDSDVAHVKSLADRACVRAHERGVVATFAICEGSEASAEIVGALDTYDCCAIVIGAHGNAPLAYLALGSTAAAVVARARVPVVCTRAPA